MVDSGVMFNNMSKGIARLAGDRSKRGIAKLIYGLTYMKLWADLNGDMVIYKMVERELRRTIHGNEDLVDEWTVAYSRIDDVGNKDYLEFAKRVADKYMKGGIVMKAKALLLYSRLKINNKIQYLYKREIFKCELNDILKNGNISDLRRAGIAILYARIAAKGDQRFRKYIRQKKIELIDKLALDKDVVLFRLTGNTKYLNSGSDLQKYWYWFVWNE